MNISSKQNIPYRFFHIESITNKFIFHDNNCLMDLHQQIRDIRDLLLPIYFPRKKAANFNQKLSGYQTIFAGKYVNLSSQVSK